MDLLVVDFLEAWMLFFGRFHPVVLHLPIGFLTAIVLLEGYTFRDKTQNLDKAKSFLLIMTSLSTVITVLFGFFLAEEGGYSQSLLAWHQWLGVAMMVCLFISLILQRKAMRGMSVKMIYGYRSSLTLTFMIMILGSHKGGSLTHGKSYLTENFPLKSKEAPLTLIAQPSSTSQKTKSAKRSNDMDLPIVVEDKINFYEQILPILEAKCISCHGTEKHRSDLRLDTADWIRKGGEGGMVLVPGDAMKSTMYEYTTLPEDDDYFMPPKGEPLTELEKQLLKKWINDGADFGDGKLHEKALIQQDKKKKVSFSPSKPRPDFSEQQKKAIHALANKGIYIRHLSLEEIELEADYSQVEKAKYLKLDHLRPLQAWVKKIDLAGQELEESEMAKLRQFEGLTHLHLERTSANDETLNHLASLKKLEYLNLYQTKVTDSGLFALFALNNLKKIFLWETQVTPTGANRLKQKITGLEVSLGEG
ncbi:MAG: c-type cytochrome domain-containing protein [Bacteroidota bacterium]